MPRAWWNRRGSARPRAVSARSRGASSLTTMLARAPPPPPAPTVEQHPLVLLRVEADVRPAHVVRDHEVHALRLELRPGACRRIAGLGGEAHEEPGAPGAGELAGGG